MQDLLSVMSKEEFISFSLRSLYSKYGYTKFRMSKFEGYDLYVQNKDFLVSENVITFTDTDGKLLALKPDVTLSIVKNSKDVGGLTKVYYNENVYRVSRGANAFKEIMQAGLECIGWVDEKTINEVLLLAGKSLQVISPNNMLVISHLDIIKGVIDYASVSLNAKSEILKLLGEKNLFGIKAVLKKENVNEDKASLIEKLGLHFRVSKLAAGDCSASMARTYDIEVWIPSMGIYKEVSSVSNANDYQARRNNTKYRDSKTGKPAFLHTLNGSGLATSRVFPALIEQYQNADGSITVPEVLRPFMGGQEIIK